MEIYKTPLAGCSGWKYEEWTGLVCRDGDVWTAWTNDQAGRGTGSTQKAAIRAAYTDRNKK